MNAEQRAADYRRLLDRVEKVLSHLHSVPRSIFAGWAGISVREIVLVIEDFERAYFSERMSANRDEAILERIRTVYAINPSPPHESREFRLLVNDSIDLASVSEWRPHLFVSSTGFACSTSSAPPPPKTCYICGKTAHCQWHVTTEAWALAAQEPAK